MNPSDLRERLLARATRAAVTLSPAHLDRIQSYYDLLSHWNERINLTAFRLRPLADETIDRLLVEPLIAGRFLDDLPFRWFDLGSGGGSPAFPLKIVRPLPHLSLVESRSRKAAFLREVVRELKLVDVDVTTERFEHVAETSGASHSAHLVTSRAVRVDSELLGSAHRLLAKGGQLLLFGARGLVFPAQQSHFQLEDELDLCPDVGSRLFRLRAL